MEQKPLDVKKACIAASLYFTGAPIGITLLAERRTVVSYAENRLPFLPTILPTAMQDWIIQQ